MIDNLVISLLHLTVKLFC